MAHPPLISPRDSPPAASRPRQRYVSGANMQSPSPPPRSKKDKRINHISTKLQDIMRTFSDQHADHYYAQLSALQLDMNLIMRAEPQKDGLDADPEAIAEQTQMAREELRRRKGLHPDAEESFTAMAGKMYGKFVDLVNEAVEERDRDLTMLWNEYQTGQAELRRSNQYKMQLARVEHALLSKTLRERLIQSVTQRRSKLMRDKEQLDIADSSALLLNPNQFSLGNPASPGGAQTNRKTRHTRLRGDNEDVGTTIVEGNKRKRKAGFEEAENESPGPASRTMDHGANSSYREAKSKMNHAQFEAPLYSVERLFTAKDLDLHIDRAHRATFAHFMRIRAQNGQSSAIGTDATGQNGTKADTGNNDETTDAAAATALESLEAADEIETFGPTSSLLAYLSHGRSQSFHATRSQRATGLDVLSSAATTTTPFMAGMHAATGKSNPCAPGPSVLEDAFATEDLDLINLGADSADMAILQQRSLDKTSVLSLGVGAEPTGAKPFRQGRDRSDATAALVGGNGSSASIGTASVPMSKTNSAAGQPAPSLGAADMRRTASSRRA